MFQSVCVLPLAAAADLLLCRMYCVYKTRFFLVMSQCIKKHLFVVAGIFWYFGQFSNLLFFGKGFLTLYHNLQSLDGISLHVGISINP